MGNVDPEPVPATPVATAVPTALGHDATATDGTAFETPSTKLESSSRRSHILGLAVIGSRAEDCGTACWASRCRASPTSAGMDARAVHTRAFSAL